MALFSSPLFFPSGAGRRRDGGVRGSYLARHVDRAPLVELLPMRRGRNPGPHVHLRQERTEKKNTHFQEAPFSKRQGVKDGTAVVFGP